MLGAGFRVYVQSEVCSVHFQCVVLFAVFRVQRVFYYPHLGSGQWRVAAELAHSTRKTID